MAQSVQFTQALQAVQQQLGAAVFDVAEKIPNWQEICLDIRGNDDSHVGKLFVTRSNGKKDMVPTPPQLNPLVTQIWELRQLLSVDDMFFGFKFSLTHDATFKTDFDNNPQCAEEPGFRVSGGSIGKMFGKFKS